MFLENTQYQEECEHSMCETFEIKTDLRRRDALSPMFIQLSIEKSSKIQSQEMQIETTGVKMEVFRICKQHAGFFSG